jgi:hypothetical protein
MRWILGVMGLGLASLAYAGSGTLRVGSEVLVVGDSATRVIELLGKPSYRAQAKDAAGSRSSNRKGSGKKSKKGGKSASSSAGGQQWQYRQGHRLVTIVVADGKVAAIRDDAR